ncbi:MAG: hypothetical protein ACT4ON_12590 [Bacteroidota bacterium]
MNNKKAKYIFASLSWMCLQLNAQDPKQEIVNINKAFNDSKKYTVDVLFNTYVIGEGPKPRKSAKCRIAKDGTNYYYRQLNSEILLTNKFSINIDHYNKIMVVKPTEKTNNNYESKVSLSIVLDSLFLLYKTVKVEKISSDKNKLTFEIKKGDLKKCEVVYNSRNYLVENLKSYYNNPVKLEDNKDHYVYTEVAYSNYSPQVKNKDLYFNHTNYFKQENKKIVLQPKYQDYQLVSN